MTAGKRRPCWRSVNAEALGEGRLPRVLAGMGFDFYVGAVPRGSVRWWRPDYCAAPTVDAVSGWFPAREDRATRLAGMEDWVESRRAMVAPLNRNLRDAPAHILALRLERPVAPAGQPYAITSHVLYRVDGYSGEWRDATGGQFGADLLTLGALRWSCSYGKAGARIARLAGFRIPTLELAA